MTRCSACILPLGANAIAAGSDGQCTYCDRAARSSSPGIRSQPAPLETRLRRMAADKRSRRPYDCMVPISGGKDSTYVLWYAVAKLGLRVLAMTVDIGYRSPQAIKNTTRSVELLGVDWVTYAPDRRTLNRLQREFLLTAGEFCTPCNALIGVAAKRIAAQHKIDLILTGNSTRPPSGSEIISPSWYFDRTYFLNVAAAALAGRQLRPFAGEPYWRRGIRRLLGREPETIPFLDYLSVSPQEITRTLTEQMDWVQPGTGPEHGDCLLNPIKDYIMYRKWGFSEITVHYADQVRAGRLDRKQALELADRNEPTEAPQYLPTFLEHLNVTGQQFEEALQLNFRDIPNARSGAFFRLAKKTTEKLSSLRGKR
ncbi:MAG: hypothetical protein JW810_08945 [Sedimentisphaerales bacterium]|nr:hypothetical protein [Sedimentisphaerales bacterium]